MSHVIPVSAGGQRLDQALVPLFAGYSRSRLSAWLKSGELLLDGLQRDPKYKVIGGETATLVQRVVDARDGVIRPEPVPLTVIYQDHDLLVLDKPPGLVVHPGSGNWHGTVQNGLLHLDPSLANIPRAGIVHRLDKDTSGLMVVARSLTAQADLVAQLQARTVSRRYYALVWGQPAATSGTVDAPLGRHPSQRTRMAVVQGGREARTHYRVIARLPHCALVECRLETGRTHQIRVHMAWLGHTLVGDPVYGRPYQGTHIPAELREFPRQALHAFSLSLLHPSDKRELGWRAPLPADMCALLLAAGLSEQQLMALQGRS